MSKNVKNRKLRKMQQNQKIYKIHILMEKSKIKNLQISNYECSFYMVRYTIFIFSTCAEYEFNIHIPSSAK